MESLQAQEWLKIDHISLLGLSDDSGHGIAGAIATSGDTPLADSLGR